MPSLWVHYKEEFEKACKDENVPLAREILANPKAQLSYAEGFDIACGPGHSVQVVKATLDPFQPRSIVSGFKQACRFNSYKVVQFFLDGTFGSLCDVELGLKLACRNGGLRTVKYLIEKGAKDFSGALYETCSNQTFYGRDEHLHIVRHLLAIGTFSEASLNLSLEKACENEYLYITRLLVDKGANDFTQLSKFFRPPKLKIPVFGKPWVREKRRNAACMFYSKFPTEVRKEELFKEAVHDLCGIFLGLQKKGIPKDLIRFNIFAYL
jgi:hypothetical protein